MSNKEKYSLDDIAIIGISLRFPKASSIDSFWNLLINNQTGIEQFDDETLKHLGVSEDDLKKPSFVKHGAVLKDVECWDNSFFGLTRKAASIMDPQQRLLLECAYEALKHAGYTAQHIARHLGIYVTVARNNYSQEFNKQASLSDRFLSFTSNDSDFAASKIAYFLDAKGPTMTINTACSSSLVCIHEAVKGIRTQECEVALAGGASILFPQAGYYYDPNMIFSPDGKCRPFDAKSQGTVFGNGVGLVLLKQLKKAIKDNDHIYTIIKGTAVNNDGRTKTNYYSPGLTGQTEVIEMALKDAQINPSTIGYVESHGTATKLGDPIELAALEEAYRKWTQNKSFAYIGSVKSNLGHLNTAAGIAGFIKTVLCLYHKTIPGTLYFQTPNPEIDFESSPFKVSSESVYWKENKEIPRRAGVSSFGIGGTNAHIILEEAPKFVTDTKVQNEYCFPISARSEKALNDYKEEILEFILQNSHLLLADISFTLQESRIDDPVRTVFFANSKEELIRKLSYKKYEENLTPDLKNWLSGKTIDWNLFKLSKNARRVGLPSHPQNRKWCKIKNHIKHQEETQSLLARPSLIYDKRITDGGWQFSSKLTLKQSALSDHHGIFPAAGYVCMLIEALQDISSQKNVSINRFNWNNILEVGERNILLNLTYENNSSDVRFQEKDKPTIYASAAVNPSTEDLLRIIPPETKSKRLDRDEVYQIFQAKGFAFGKSYQLINEVNIYSGFAESTLRKFTTSHSERTTSIQFIDAILQTALFSIEEFSEDFSVYIPLNLDNISLFGELQGEFKVFSKLTDVSLNIKTIDIQLINTQNNNVLLQLKSMKYLKTSGIKKEMLHNRDTKDSIIENETNKSNNITEFLIGTISKELGNETFQSISVFDSIESLGLDSVTLINIVNQLETVFPKIPKTLFFEHKDLQDIIHYLVEKYPTEAAGYLKDSNGKSLASSNHTMPRKNSTMTNIRTSDYSFNKAERNVSSRDIAIIGIHGVYPEARDLDEYWENLKVGRDCIKEIPEDRWDMTDFYHKEVDHPKTSYSKWGGFIKDMQYFDPLFFKIPPKEIEVVDPQERLFLESCWLAIENAGYTPENICGQDRQVGVYVGVMWAHYQLFSANDDQRLNANLTNTSSFWSIANRVSYVMNFSGASMAIDTACSSSLSALHIACNSIIAEENEIALVGGVNLNVHPLKYYLLSERRFAAQDGRCRSFGIGGTGYVPGEGVGTLVIKPLQKAIKDNDHVYGIIKGTSVNHGGKSNGYSVPSVRAQANVIDLAMRRADITPRDITYIEAHGTGTSLGDPIEINGLRRAYQTDSATFEHLLPIGSVKSNIGHLESAAGVAALHKVLLQLQHKKLVPSIHSDILNPNIEFQGTPFRVQKHFEDWKLPEGVKKHTVGISSFGAGGSNAHIIIEEFFQTVKANHKNCPIVVILSAREKDTLQKYASNLSNYLKTNSSTNIIDLAYTLQVGRIELEHRLAFVVSSVSEAIDKLDAFSEDLPGNNNYNLLQRESMPRSSQEAVAVALKSNNHHDLAYLWLQGLRVDWKLLYEDDKLPNRIPLPTYPFKKRWLWFKKEEKRLSEDNTDAKIFDVPIPQKSEYANANKSINQPHITDYTSSSQITNQTSKVAYLNLNHKRVALFEDQSNRDIGILLNSSQELLNSFSVYYNQPVLLWKESLDMSGWGNKFEHFPKDTVIDIIIPFKEAITYYRSVDNIFDSFFQFIKSVGSDLRKFKVNILVFAHTLSLSDLPAFRSVGSLFKVANKEILKFNFKTVEIQDELHTDKLSKLLINELNGINKDKKIEVIYSSEKRYEYVVSSFSKLSSNSISIRTNGVYIITGGIGAIGIALGEYILSQGAGQIVLLGRRSHTHLSSETKKYLAENSEKVSYKQVDISNDLKPSFDQIRKSYGTINGIVHAAGIVRDKMILMKSDDVFHSVINPKINGVLNIDKAISDVPVDFVVYCSSISAIEGQIGQIDYSAANRYMDEYAQVRNAQQDKTSYLSINWPYWEDGGMQLPGKILEMMRDNGILGITHAEGVEAFRFVLEKNYSGMIVFKYDKNGADVFFNDNHLDLQYSNIVYPEKVKSEERYDTTLHSQSINNIAAELREKIVTIFCELLGLEEDIDTTIDLEEYGIDSVSLMKLSTEIEKLLDGFSIATFFESRTIDAIIEKIKEEIVEGNLTYLGKVPSTSENESSTNMNANSMYIQDEYKTPLDNIKYVIVSTLSDLLGLDDDELDTSQDLQEYGVDSVAIMKLVSEIEKHIDGFSVSTFFECRSIDDLIEKLKIDFNEGIVNSVEDLTKLTEKSEEVIEQVSQKDFSDKISIQKIKEFIVDILCNSLGLSSSEVDASTDLQDYGVDSIILMKLSSELEKEIEGFSVALFFGCETINDIAKKIQEEIDLGNMSLLSSFNSSNTEANADATINSDFPTYYEFLQRNDKNDSLEIIVSLKVEDPLIAHHVIKSKITFPGAGYISLITKLYEITFNNTFTSISNIVWYQPLLFESQDIQAKIFFSKDSKRTKFSVQVGDTTYAKGEVSGEPISKDVSIGSVKEMLTKFSNTLSGQEVYNWFADHHFIYKNSYQVIDRLYVNSNTVLGKLAAKDHVLSPAIIDGAFQCIAGINASKHEDTTQFWLPFFIEKITIYNSILPQTVYAYAEQDLSVKERDMQKFNIYIISESGEVFVYAKNFTLKAFKASTLAIPNQKADTIDGGPKLNIREAPLLTQKIKSESIAIISMSCKIPGADNPRQFWDNLIHQKHLITEIPENRWNYESFYHSEKGKLGTIYSKWGGFISDVDAFDANFFKMKEADVISLDPQQRILLELSQHLFDRAGYSRKEVANKNLSVIIGAAAGMWRDVLDKTSEKQSKTRVVNTIQNMIAARIADFYDLKGLTYTMDTACSSSLVAVHEACQKIRSGECEMAIAGGITLLLSEAGHLGFCSAQVLSENGRCAVFDKNADGIVLGEGAGLLLLKSYSKAVEDGDQILGVIKGSSVNNDGRTMGLTTPNMSMQEEVIANAYRSSDIDPSTISYLEAHGTGTLLGDPIEVKAATNVFSKYTDKRQFCGIGSVKSNVGHLLHASGVIGLMKIILSLQHETIPATLHCSEPHPRFEFHNSPFYPVTQSIRWKNSVSNQPRRAAISSFGFGGTNCHAIIEEVSPVYQATRQPLLMTKFDRKRFWPGKPITSIEQKQSLVVPLTEEVTNMVFRSKEDILELLKLKKITIDQALELEESLLS